MNTKNGLIWCVIFLFLACSSDDGESRNELEGEEFIGTWQLIAINVSTAIDVNNDGNTSNNLLDEVPCLQEILVLDRTLTYTSNAVNVQLITAITGALYNVSCTDTQATDGNWGAQNGNLFLVGNTTREFSFNGELLTETLGNDLPGLQSLVYQKQ